MSGCCDEDQRSRRKRSGSIKRSVEEYPGDGVNATVTSALCLSVFVFVRVCRRVGVCRLLRGVSLSHPRAPSATSAEWFHSSYLLDFFSQISHMYRWMQFIYRQHANQAFSLHLLCRAQYAPVVLGITAYPIGYYAGYSSSGIQLSERGRDCSYDIYNICRGTSGQNSLT